MATDIVMPNLGFDTQTGRLVEWVKKPGESVKRGEVLAIVESDKANVELESIAAGVLLEQLVPEDTEVNVGAVIARVGAADEVVKQAAAPVQMQAPAAATSQPAEVSAVARRMASEHNLDLSGVRGTGPRGRITREDVEGLIGKTPSNGNGKNGNGRALALPKVRKAARDAGINLAEVPATGAHGEVTLADLEAYYNAAEATMPTMPTVAIAPPPPPTLPEAIPALADAREIPMTRIRHLIGERLSKSKREAPHFYVMGEFDLEAGLKQLKRLPDPQPRINDLLQYLTVQCLLRVPELNATYENDRLYQYQTVNLAVAVARDDGLITPVIAHAERYSLQGLAAESRALIQRARENRLQPADLQGGTFTVSNLGVIGQVERFTAVINPPQVGILTAGSVKPRPVVVDGGLHIRSTVHLTLSGDHRAVDGMHLGRFMAFFQEELDRFAL